MTETKTFYLFGIPVWRTSRTVNVTDEDAVYQRLSERFSAEMRAALDYARQPH